MKCDIFNVLFMTRLDALVHIMHRMTVHVVAYNKMLTGQWVD